MPNYQAKDSQVLNRQLEVQELNIPFYITHNATPASVLVTCDEPSLLFINTQGVTQITVANGAYDTSAEAAGVTFATPVDSSGLFNMLVRINEDTAVKLLTMNVSSRNNQGAGAGYLPSAPTNGITSVGNKFVFNVQCASADFATTDYDGCLTIRYVTGQ
jgi:hypothetical protein